ncbi:hypothetical protein AMEX_G18027 [Astyanax mexicanus]|uniref:NRDE-2, necessary for RNA interference, domain containing n=1 Tax=Astyanax mexicanus TaxID=7994 RepID=A0A8T2LHZ5_ASTMX|nr:hypothetical protein AMEX_G18027 [Astyanax mexicanus]
MALFPAFSGAPDSQRAQGTELEWLNNQSFRADAAQSVHQRAAEKDTPTSSPASPQRAEEQEDGRSVGSKRKKKKEKKKKRKKQKKRSRGGSDGSGSDTVYPSDLLTQPEPPITERVECVSEGKFVWLDDLQNLSDPPFCIDRRSDPNNWQYKSLYRADIARYRRRGGAVLGLDGRTQAVLWDDAPQDKKRVERKPERYFHSSIQQLLRSEPITALPTAPPTDPADSAPFLPLPPCPELQDAPARAGGTQVDPLGVYDPGTALYLEGRGRPKTEELRPGGADSAALLTARTEEFNRNLRQNPTHIQLWLDFIRFQDEVSGGCGAALGAVPGAEGDGERGRLTVRALLERKLAIVERALEVNPGSVELKLVKLALCQELWDPPALLKEWKKLVFLHPNSSTLWRRFLLFTQTHFSSFSTSRVSAAYAKCLSTLSAVQDGTMLSHPPLPGTEEELLEIFLLQCHFLRQAGQSEKALSLFQALLDFTFYKPDTVTHLNTRQQVEFFEPFWDSGEPRVGERGGRGWRAWMLQQERGGWVVPPETEDDDDDEDQDECEIRDKSQPKWRIWLDVETSREAKHWLPWRPDKSKGQSEEDCEDPDRQVLFDDIGPSLIRVESASLKLRLLLAFLRFLGLPDPSAPPPSSTLLDDSALLDLSLDSERPLTSCHLPLTGISAVGHMTHLSDVRKHVGLCKEGEEFLGNVLERVLPLVRAPDRTALSLCWLQYEKLKVLRCVYSSSSKRLRVAVRRGKRVGKRLLKLPENRSSLSLWREYAHLQWIVGNVEEGRRVFDTALAVGGASGLQDHTLCELCLLYAQLEVEQACMGGAKASVAPPTGSRAVYVLSRLAEGGGYSGFSGQVNPVSVLKARKAYENALSAAAEGGTPRSALIGCFGLFQYLTVGIDAADAVFTEARERLTPGTATATGTEPDPSLREREAVCVLHVALLRLHSSTSAFPLSRLRMALTDALRLLPCSATLWHFYLLTESRYHSAGRARRFFHTVARGNQTIIPHLFSITAEQRRKQHLDSVIRLGLPADALPVIPETGLSNRIRSLFEVAVATEEGAHCPLLWRMYMNFMVCNGDTERGRGIFYKALQNVPWAKCVYMDAVRLFPDRVQEFLDLLVEKELRLRAPMEEVEILLEE